MNSQSRLSTGQRWAGYAAAVAAATSVAFLSAVGLHPTLLVAPLVCVIPVIARPRWFSRVAFALAELVMVVFVIIGSSSVGLYYLPATILIVVARDLHLLSLGAETRSA